MTTIQVYNFNPRSREGSDLARKKVIQMFNISIHAPARGATNGVAGRGRSRDISIHAPARGATNFCKPTQVGGTISIHAPARGATTISLPF